MSRAAAALTGVAAAGRHLAVVLLRGTRAVLAPPAHAVSGRAARRFGLELDVAHALARLVARARGHGTPHRP